MLQQEQPQDFVIAMGEKHSVREFVELAFKEVGITIRWEGSGLNEVGVNEENGKVIIHIHPDYLRPSEVDQLLGDATRSYNVLGWRPKHTFEQLVQEMVHSEIQHVETLISASA